MKKTTASFAWAGATNSLYLYDRTMGSIPIVAETGTSLRKATAGFRQAARSMGCVTVALGILMVSFRISLTLSTVVSIELLLVVVVALRWGLLQASIVSVIAVLGLDYLFVQPIFKLSVSSPSDWISLFTFESTALIVSLLSTRVRAHSAEAEVQRSRIAMLYELSRAILLIDRQQSKGEGLAEAIQQTTLAQRVYVWDIYTEARPSEIAAEADAKLAIETYRVGEDTDHTSQGVSTRVLRIGTTSIGALVLRGWTGDATTADAIASLAAVAVERARSLEKQTRAEAAKETEQLRTAVLDALAHGFKTPLTAILTGSSGLLAIGDLSVDQTELVGLIDHEARNLNALTTRLLKTSALDSNKVRLNLTTFLVRELLEDVAALAPLISRDLIVLSIRPDVEEIHADRELMRLALAQLLDNALKYSRVGSNVILGAQQQESELVVSVENVGDPIPHEERERIFERFYRGSDAIHGPAGTGLGLAVVRKIAEAHHGSATVACEAGTTLFSLTIYNRKQR